MKKKVTSEYGITLVSLVITVVVMVLLAGVIINLNDSNEGVLDIANQKKEETEILSIKEEIKTFLAENPPDNYESLIETLKNYGTIQDENDPENATLITNNGNYLIPVKDIWNVNASFSALEIGDYVSYKPQNASYLVSKDYSGNTSNVTVSLSNTDNIIWRVLDIDYNNGEIKLVPSSSLGLNLSVGGVNGYNNIVKLSNDLCDTLFSNEEKSVKARNLNLEDIEKIASNIEDLKGSSYGTEKDYTATRYKYPSILGEENSDSAQNKFVTGDETVDELNSIQTYYTGQISFSSTKYRGILPNGTYFLSSRGINNYTNEVQYYARIITNNSSSTTINGTMLYDSDGNNSQVTTYSILPVLIIKDNTIVTYGDGTINKPFYIR